MGTARNPLRGPHKGLLTTDRAKMRSETYFRFGARHGRRAFWFRRVRGAELTLLRREKSRPERGPRKKRKEKGSHGQDDATVNSVDNKFN